MSGRLLAAGALAALLAACAASPPRGGAEAAASSPAAEPAAQGYPQPSPQQPAAPLPAAVAPAPSADGPRPEAVPGGGSYAEPPDRRIALGRAGREIETAQRELDVAGGDCRNACRALGSMDRAAGRLCSLAQSNDERSRCDDAKGRVYSARDKVKSACGRCDDVSVDRRDPIPSGPSSPSSR